MDAETRRKIAEVFADALELDGTDREAYLDGVCSGDSALRHEVETLLRMHPDGRAAFEGILRRQRDDAFRALANYERSEGRSNNEVRDEPRDDA